MPSANPSMLSKRHFCAGLAAYSTSLLTSRGLAAAPPSWNFEIPLDETIHGQASMKHVIAHLEKKKFSMQLVLWSSKQASLNLLDNGSDQKNPKIGSLATACQQSSTTIAGINAGFFHPDFRPAGLMISQQHRTGKWEDSSLLGGVWVKDARGESLLWKKEFQDHPKIESLVQAGPRLVVEGQPITQFQNDRIRPRSFLITNGKDLWALGKADLVSLGDLATSISQLKDVLGWYPKRALNLDGGSSSGLWWRRLNGEERSNREWVTVRNFLILNHR